MLSEPAKEEAKVTGRVRVSVFPDAETEEPELLKVHWLLDREPELAGTIGPSQEAPAQN